MEEACNKIKDDMHNMEEDSKKIDCCAIVDLKIHSCVYYIVLNVAFVK